jgi:NarL family two-component system response regulator LiaR
MSEPITVLVVDDHPLVRHGVSGFLAAQGGIEVVAEAGSAEEALVLAGEHAPDVALVDLVMPGSKGRGTGPQPRPGFPALAAAVRKAAAGEATLHPAVAARVIAELRVDQNGVPPNPFKALSNREVEVLRLVAEGLSNAEIARRLYISEKTVKSHVSNVLAKLQLTDRTQAAAYAWRAGVVEP